MKIGLDIHGVIDTYPEFFGPWSQRLMKDGHQIHIITGSQITPGLENQLRLHGMAYTAIHSITDYWIKRDPTVVSFKDPKNPIMANELWNVTKAIICRDNKIDLHIDDSEIYGKYFVGVCPETVYVKVSKISEHPGLHLLLWDSLPLAL